MDYYSELKRNQHTATGTSLKGTVLSERSHTQRHSVVFLFYVIHVKTNRQKTDQSLPRTGDQGMG
jgi:hypothetical protein